jgi:DMSO reductase anchor subunit
MQPALSVVAFTVLSGAGLGALAVLAVADVAIAWGLGAAPSATVAMRSALVALALVVAGLCSSALHLANPRNAWRSLSRWRTSWLSREAAFALLLLASASAWIALQYLGVDPRARAPLALITLALSWTTLYCTSMIYASLKPIRQWHTHRVPIAYLALGHASGALVVAAMSAAYGEPVRAIALVAGALLAIAALVKYEYYVFIASDRARATLEDAIGVASYGAAARSTVMSARLLDVGHSRGTFLTREFGYSLDAARRNALRAVFWMAGVAVPALWLAFGIRDWRGAAGACLLCLAGIAAERWLFFAEARHTVRLYHGDRTT